MDRKTLILCLSGGLLYIPVSEILSDWNHVLAAIFGAIAFIVIYCLLPQKWNIWLRVLIPIGVAILIALIIRFISY